MAFYVTLRVLCLLVCYLKNSWMLGGFTNAKGSQIRNSFKHDIFSSHKPQDHSCLKNKNSKSSTFHARLNLESRAESINEFFVAWNRARCAFVSTQVQNTKKLPNEKNKRLVTDQWN
ncbi:Piso0_005836 [Millerozyma farinosa CBS 7064]|uniref:Piso0_005836 protein n=1 Tax=Pichia sorbitophila (strain ATCC MYA-4447 / BCRC 22081 / CBS 7064 / NBRC 10061 / NRRL Y-12695) TaxID=559304 RepID=G8Y319_PICSO|nr:Piso0_005836 [Millerozyma farinosa CBS 7064]